MPQHALWREDDQRLAPHAARLPAQHMKILRGRRRLTDLHVVFRSKLHETLKARAGMLRSLPLITVREQKDQPAWQIPFVFRSAQKLVDDPLRAVGKIPELRLPHNQRLRIVAAEAVFESHASRFGERGVVNLAKSLPAREMR